jgi:hypothetical protein
MLSQINNLKQIMERDISKLYLLPYQTIPAKQPIQTVSKDHIYFLSFLSNLITET